MISIDSRRKSLPTLQRQHPGATIIDVTSKAAEPWVRFSPFYPHGGIPIPGRSDQGESDQGQSVEGIWQGLKVFEKEDVDPIKWTITNMKGIKRGGTKRGKVLGHRFGQELLGYLEARRKIYLPIYRWVLEHRVPDLVEQLRAIKGDVVLLDYETNWDVEDLSRPLSHASLVAKWVRDEWPA